MNSLNEIRQYWDKRATEHKSDLQGTTNDVYLRELEIKTIEKEIKTLGLTEGSKIIDVGCGDGYSTARLAKAFPQYCFTGVDYSDSMIKNAYKKIEHDVELEENLQFMVADVLNLQDIFGEEKFDVVLTMRVLINLPDLSIQNIGIRNISKICKKGGYYIAVENFMDGQRNMNELREELGLVEIPVRWHNLFFEKENFKQIAEENFKNCTFINFASSYYYVTRIIYSKLCQLQNIEPSYEHDLYRIAVELPFQGEFSPIRMVIMEK